MERTPHGEARHLPDSPALETLAALIEGRTGTLLSLGLILVLGALAILLPPFSLGGRVLDASYAVVPPGGSVTNPDGAQITFPGEAIARPIKARFASIPRLDLLEGTVSAEMLAAARALPPTLVIKSPVYLLSLKGGRPSQTIWRLPIPDGAEPYSLLDLYQWDGSAWTWLPHRLDLQTREIEVTWPGAPQALAIMQAQRTVSVISAETGSSASFAIEARETLELVSPRLYLVNGDGTIGQLFTMPPEAQGSGAALIPVLHNRQSDGVVRSDLVDNLLISEATWRAHIDHVVSLVAGTPYDGIEIDYQNVDPALRPEFTTFIAELARRLHEQQKLLIVRTGAPERVGIDRYDTGAYDWLALGLAADEVRIPAPFGPRVRVGDTVGELDVLLGWATGLVNRYKLALLLPVASYELAGGEARAVPYAQALARLGELHLRSPDNVIEPDESAAFELPLLREGAGLTLDPETKTYRFSYVDAAGQGHTIWLENAVSLAEKLQIVSQYNIGGIALRDVAEADPRIWQSLAEYQRNDLGVTQLQNRFAVVWRVQNDRGDQIAGEVRPASDPTFVFQPPAQPGVFRVSAA
ncbi:MAG TPA: hypothetical protein VER55_12610, partial [Ardenticatenaceae bacterium]|nr:hypothetical protein [Ardenticatenaceae bacterium]